MNESFTAAIKEAFALAPTTKVILHTLEIRQDGVQDPIWIVQSRRTLEAKDELGVDRVFEPVGFQFALPPSNEEGFRSLTLSIDNVGRRVMDFVETAKTERETVVIRYRPYLSDDLTGPQMDPPLELYLKDIQVNTHQVSGRATFADVVNKKFPSQTYTRERFPALG